jgi:hypothetical protein
MGKAMDLKTSLERVTQHYLQEVNNLSKFVLTTEKYLTRKQKRRVKPKFTKSEIKQLDLLIKFLTNVSSGKGKKRSFRVKSANVTKLVAQIIPPIIYKGYIAEMMLSYIIAHQEAFIKDYIYQVLVYNRSMLKSKANVTHETILGHRNMKSLVEHLAQKEVDTIGYKSIDDVRDYIGSKFNIDLAAFGTWNELVEANCRRNLIVHNRGVTNETYCRKTGFKKRGVHLDTEIDYVLKIAKILVCFVKYVDEEIRRKLKLK